MASNIQAGTRGLSAGDWIRLKRLQAPRGLVYYKQGLNSPPHVEFNKDITNSTLRLEPESGRRVYTEFGTSKIRRPASSWTDYIASQTADYVLEKQDVETKSRSLDATKACDCSTVDAIKHNGLCITCKHEKRTNLYPLAQQPSCTNCGS